MQLVPQRLAFVALPVRDVEISRRFYGQLVGLAQVDAVTFDFAGVPLRLVADARRAGGPTGLVFHVADVDDAAARMVTFRTADVRATPLGRAVTIRDPDGNTFDFLQSPPPAAADDSRLTS